MAIYRIHPGIGIARLGNSPDEFCITPEKPAALPIACDAKGNPSVSPDGTTELTVKTFKDDEGRIKRQAARFQIYVYDDESPEGDRSRSAIRSRGAATRARWWTCSGASIWRTRRPPWYEFQQQDGEHGYNPSQQRGATRTSPIRRRASD